MSIYSSIISYTELAWCTTPVSSNTNGCYWVGAEQTNFPTALLSCRDKGGSLAILDAVESVNFVLSNFKYLYVEPYFFIFSMHCKIYI